MACGTHEPRRYELSRERTSWRNGCRDCTLDITPKGAPGKPDTAAPEHLFAAGYAACFGGAPDFVAKQRRKDATKAEVTCAVSIGPRDGGGFGLAANLMIEDESLAQSERAALATEAHEKICPYSHATRGNVHVQLEVEGA